MDKGTQGHTPGPWRINRDDSEGYMHIEHETEASGVYTVATMHEAFAMHGATETDANAALIASAPALLAERDALRARVERLEEGARQVIWKLSHNHKLDDYSGPARITREDATVKMLAAALAEGDR